MSHHTSGLWQLAFELLDYSTLKQLQALVTGRPFDVQALLDLDRRIGGPGIYNLNTDDTPPYENADEAIFRPIQNCYNYFRAGALSLEALTNEVVRMMGLHLDNLIREASGKWLGWLPLGQTLRHNAVKERLDPLAWDQMARFTHCTNDAAGFLSVQFSVEDAVVAYIVGRKLAEALYPLVELQTPVRAFYRTRYACV